MARRFGMWTAIASLLASVGYGIPQILQVAGILHDPWDRILIFAPSLILAPCFVLTMAAVHASAPADRSVFSLSGLALAIMYAVLVSSVYVTQLSVVIPHDLAGDGAAYALLACCGYHHYLTGIDLLGYTLMSLSTLIAAPATGTGPSARSARRWLIANGVLAPVLLGQVIWPQLIWLGALWLVTFPMAMLMLAVTFGRGDKR